MDHLSVDADQAYNISRAVGNDAQELREELAGLQRDWDNLSREWSGGFVGVLGDLVRVAGGRHHARRRTCRVVAQPGRRGGVLLRADAGMAAALRSTPIDLGI